MVSGLPINAIRLCDGGLRKLLRGKTDLLKGNQEVVLDHRLLRGVGWVGSRLKETRMCDQWWDERLMRERAEELKRAITAPVSRAKPAMENPERKPESQPDPVPV